MKFVWVSTTIKNMHVRIYLQCISLTEVLAKIWNRSPGGALCLPTAPKGRVKCRDQISLHAVCVTNEVPLSLFQLNIAANLSI